MIMVSPTMSTNAVTNSTSSRAITRRLPSQCSRTFHFGHPPQRRDTLEDYTLREPGNSKERPMEIRRSGSQPSGKGPATYFSGAVRIDPLFDAPEPARVVGASVTFEPGSR